MNFFSSIQYQKNRSVNIYRFFLEDIYMQKMSEINVDILKQEILSLLVSAKYGLNEHELLNDYRMFNSNKDLPYRELGYSSLISLLRSWPDICRFQQQGNNGAMKILAVEEESTKHILSMVKGQRAGKSRRRTRGGQNRGRGGNRNDTRFSQGYFNNNRSGGNNRGTTNNYNRPNRGQSNQNSRYKSNVRFSLDIFLEG